MVAMRGKSARPRDGLRARVLRAALGLLQIFALLQVWALLAPAAAQSAKPTAASAQAGQDADAVVRALYQNYFDTAPEAVVSFNYYDPAAAKSFFDPTLAKLLAADAKRDAARLDFDPFIDGQEFELSPVTYQTRVVSPKEALVTAQFLNFDETKSIVYKVVRTASGWRIADVQWGGGRDSLRTLLAKAGK
ncbi:hypothetical protein V5F77_06870 [Xanthobacter sp. DSM 24535]|uniref:hypothetical protein n=1 Tax=Roseixanthobacter psychrophilus TaxID=3119917 RepID=UPI00372A285A